MACQWKSSRKDEQRWAGFESTAATPVTLIGPPTVFRTEALPLGQPSTPRPKTGLRAYQRVDLLFLIAFREALEGSGSALLVCGMD
jgi:hypothetical protein